MRRFSFPFALRRAPDSGTLPVTLQPTDPVTAPLGAERGGGNVSAPASLRGIGGDSGNFGRVAIDDDINAGPVPDYINRGTRALNAGAIGPGMSTWPYDANREYLEHTQIPRTPETVTPFGRTIDTGVTIPSVGIGAPLT